ncbi:MAG: hypothetical protein QF570_04145 [Myxococcota bacterium]|jgi:hypothetical protein|nr:hypothetical protein [Myxococcota bacterium]
MHEAPRSTSSGASGASLLVAPFTASPLHRVVFLAVACFSFALLWSDYSGYWLDDAFITFRYAKHLAMGLGPVFNSAERVEGYTSFLWMLFAALPLAVSSVATSLASYKAFALLVSLWMLFRVVRFPSPGPGETTRVFVVVLACQPIFILNCGDGMETPLLMLLMLETALALQRAPTTRNGGLCGALVAAMVWTRPEALPFLAAAPALIAVAYRGSGRSVRGWMSGFVLAAGVPIAGQEIFRVLYYGALWPNTFYAKATGDLLARLSRGGVDFGRFFFANPWSPPAALWVMSVLALIATWRVRAQLVAKHASTLCWFGALWLMIVFRVSFDIWSGSDTMGRHRFLAPLIVPLAILADEGARMLWRGRARFVVAAAFVLAIGFNVSGHTVHVATTRPYAEGLERAHVALGGWLRESQPRDALLAIADAGAVPFFSELETVDLWGLNDATIARLPGEYGERPGMVDYVMQRDPDLIVLWNQRPFLDASGGDATSGTQGKLLGGQALDHAIATDARFRARYRFVREFVFREERTNFPGYYLDVFERRATPRTTPPATGPDS